MPFIRTCIFYLAFVYTSPLRRNIKKAVRLIFHRFFFAYSVIVCMFAVRVTYILILGQNNKYILYKILGKPVKVVIGETHNDFMPACK